MQRIWHFLRPGIRRVINSVPVQALLIGSVLYATGREPFAPVGGYLIVGTLVYVALIGFGDLFRLE